MFPELICQRLDSDEGKVVGNLVRFAGVGPGHDLDMTGVEASAGVDEIEFCSVEPVVKEDREHDADNNGQDREQAAGAVPHQAFKKESNHDIRPRSASVGFSLAILRVGKKLTMVVITRTSSVVAITSPRL